SLDASLPLREERTSSRSPAHIEECAPGRFYARRVRAWLRRSSGLQLRQAEIGKANAGRQQRMRQRAERRGQPRVVAVDEVPLWNNKPKTVRDLDLLVFGWNRYPNEH